jgi:hypothetical protein
VRVRNSAEEIEIEPAALAFAIVARDGTECPAKSLPATEDRGPFRPRLPRTLAPGESYTQRFVFDVPDSTLEPELWIWTDDRLGRLLPRIPANPLIELMRVPLVRVGPGERRDPG